MPYLFDQHIFHDCRQITLNLLPTVELLDRTQRVKIGNNYSHTGLPNGGVPQGTICGPKCFMIYRNDLSTPVPLYKYVDDSTLFEICEINSISLMQESVNIAAEWTNNNDMKINSEKSKEMIISYAHGNIGNEVPNILIDGKVVGTSGPC